MKRRILLCVIGLIFAVSVFVGCAAQTEQEDDTLYQVSTLQALILGDYDGSITAGELTQYGDTGLGTFDGLDGEMIVLDGVVYKASVDGKVSAVPDDETVPFANVAFLTDTQASKLAFTGGLDALKSALDEQFPDENMPVLFTISGEFTNIEYRSVPEQEKPYPPLTDVVKEQAVFDADTISGTLVGFRFPSYMDNLNVDGYHLHFISDDTTKGGHLLAVDSGSANVIAQTLDEFSVYFPQTIKDLDLDTSDDGDVDKVEKK